MRSAGCVLCSLPSHGGTKHSSSDNLADLSAHATRHSCRHSDCTAPPGNGLAERRSILHNAALGFKFSRLTLRYEVLRPKCIDCCRCFWMSSHPPAVTTIGACLCCSSHRSHDIILIGSHIRPPAQAAAKKRNPSRDRGALCAPAVLPSQVSPPVEGPLTACIALRLRRTWRYAGVCNVSWSPTRPLGKSVHGTHEKGLVHATPRCVLDFVEMRVDRDKSRCRTAFEVAGSRCGTRPSTTIATRPPHVSVVAWWTAGLRLSFCRCSGGEVQDLSSVSMPLGSA